MSAFRHGRLKQSMIIKLAFGRENNKFAYGRLRSLLPWVAYGPDVYESWGRAESRLSLMVQAGYDSFQSGFWNSAQNDGIDTQ